MVWLIGVPLMTALGVALFFLVKGRRLQKGLRQIQKYSLCRDPKNPTATELLDGVSRKKIKLVQQSRHVRLAMQNYDPSFNCSPFESVEHTLEEFLAGQMDPKRYYEAIPNMANLLKPFLSLAMSSNLNEPVRNSIINWMKEMSQWARATNAAYRHLQKEAQAEKKGQAL